MSMLSQIVVPTTDIVTLGGTFTVRGLNSEDVSLIATKFYSEISQLFEEAKGEEGPSDAAILSAVSKFPALMGRIIAIAAGDATDAGQKAAQALPMGIQVAAMKAIMALTFGEVGGAKNVIRDVLTMIGVDVPDLTSLMAKVAPDSTN